tara:strand:+ start:66 stop:371 length:306 start_codon:yes stop_codon:yes gene_type:complete
MGRTRKYTTEFKEESIKLAINTGNVKQTANNLGIPESTLSTWIKSKSGINFASKINKNSTKNIDITSVLSEVKSLKKQLARSEQEKEILKKAMAYFAKDQA